jgi:hypothetical protein
MFGVGVAVDGSIAFIVPIKDGIIVQIKWASGFVNHGDSTRLDTVNHWALVGIGRGVAEVHGIGNKIGVGIRASHDGKILGHGIIIIIKFERTSEGKAGCSRCGHTVVDGVWHAVHVEIGAPIGSTHCICVRAPIGTIDHTIQIRVSIVAGIGTAGSTSTAVLVGTGIKFVGDAVSIGVLATIPCQAEARDGGEVITVVVRDSIGAFEGAPILTVGDAVQVGIDGVAISIQELWTSGRAEILRTGVGGAVLAETHLRRAGIEPVGDEVAVEILVDEIQRCRVDGRDVVIVLDGRFGVTVCRAGLSCRRVQSGD